MGMLEDHLTEVHRMAERDARIAQLEDALNACVRAMREVQDWWGDPSSWIHNRLEMPFLIYDLRLEREPTIKSMREIPTAISANDANNTPAPRRSRDRQTDLLEEIRDLLKQIAQRTNHSS